MAEYNSSSGFFNSFGYSGYNNPNEPSFVFYNILNDNTEMHKALYRKATENIQSYVNEANFKSRREESADKLFAMAEAELTKERNMLKMVFGNEFNVNLEKPGDVKIFVDKIQTLFKDKGTIERSAERLLKGEKHISIAPFIPQYFQKSLKEDMDKHYRAYVNNALKGPEKFEEYIKKNRLSIIWDNALTYLANSKNINTNNEEEARGYLEFFTYLKTNQILKESFTSQIDALGLNNILSELSANLRNRQVNKTGKRGKNVFGKSGLKVNFQKGGDMQEILAETMINALSSIGKNTPNITIEAKRTGEYKGRPDLLVGVGLSVPTTDIADSFKLMPDAKRESARIVAKDILSKLKELDSGFLIFLNAKNYQLDEKTHYKGTEDMALKDYSSLLDGIQSQAKLSHFVTAIMNTLSGAVGENYKEQLADLISQDIAYFLFDDFEAIGTSQPVGEKCIHIFLLSDFYVPLSLFLYLLASAFEEVEEEGIRKYATISIKAGKIDYPNGPWTKEMWIAQRQSALEDIKIGVHFFKDFQQMIQEQLR